MLSSILGNGRHSAQERRQAHVIPVQSLCNTLTVSSRHQDAISSSGPETQPSVHGKLSANLHSLRSRDGILSEARAAGFWAHQ